MQSHMPGGDTDTRALFKLAVGLSLAFLFVFLYGSELPVAPIVVIIEFCKMVTELTHALIRSFSYPGCGESTRNLVKHHHTYI